MSTDDFIVTSKITYLIYKRFEPASSFVHFTLLLGVPGCLYTWRNLSGDSSKSPSAILLSYWTAILAFVVLYRLSPFHPLAGYPGPSLAKVSKFWMVYATFRGDTHNAIKDLHSQYGDIVRIGAITYSSSNALILTVLATRSERIVFLSP